MEKLDTKKVTQLCSYLNYAVCRNKETWTKKYSMRIKLCLFYIVISLTNYTFCKNTEKTNSKINNMSTFIKMHGTYQIAAICKDGIVVGTDTRCSIDDGNRHIMCYYDSVQKVFPFKNYAISSSGSMLINGKYLFYYYKQFEAAKKKCLRM